MTEIENFLNKLDDFELAFFAKFKLPTYLPASQKKIKQFLKNQNITGSRIEKLIAENPKKKLIDCKNCCPRCYSTNFSINKVDWNTEGEIGFKDEIAIIDNLFNKQTYRKEIICNVCGFWIEDPNNQNGKKNNKGVINTILKFLE